MSKAFLIASGKGGTGKTMFTVNLGCTLAEKGYKVVLIDLDVGQRNLDLYLGLENNVVFDVYDVLKGVCRIKQGMIKDKNYENLYLMASSPQRDDGEVTPLHMQILIKKLKKHFDYILIDAPSGIDDVLVLAASGADEAIIVTCPEYAAIRDADILDRELGKLDMGKRCFILNKVDADLISMGFAPGIADISKVMRMDLLGIIQEDKNIQISTNVGVPIVCKEGTYIKENFKKIANRITK